MTEKGFFRFLNNSQPVSRSPSSLRHTGHWSLSGRQAHAATLPYLDMARLRLIPVALAFVLLYAALLFRLFDVMILGAGNEPRAGELAPSLSVKHSDITDRNGELLATSLQMATLVADPAYMLDADDAIKKLKKVLPELNEKDIRQDIQSKKRFIVLKHNLTPKQQEAINRLGIPGISFENEEKRVYPKSNLTAHIIGFRSVDNQGLAGLEKTLDASLKKGNGPVALSIDIRLQGILREALAESVKTFSAVGAAGLIMDVNTGEMLALASLPDFDPHEAGKASDQARFNRATLGMYEMGSTFKIFTLAQGLDKGLITLSSGFDCRKPLKYGRFSIDDFHAQRRWLNIPEIFLHSSNIGAAQIAEKIGTAAQKEFLGSLGLLDTSPIEIPEVGRPLIPSPWRDINTVTISFGHGLAVNAVQLASAAASIINGGFLVPPTLLRKDEGTAQKKIPIISEHTSEQMRKLMRVVVSDGTGKSAQVSGYFVGGKTGTAEKKGGGGYNKDSRLSSFLGAFPIHEPRFLIYVMIDEPKGTKETHGFATGGWVAAPAVGRIISQISPLLGLSPMDDNDAFIKQRLSLPVGVRGE